MFKIASCLTKLLSERTDKMIKKETELDFSCRITCYNLFKKHVYLNILC